MAFSKEELLKIYRKRAGAYDFSANLYYLIGFREARYRQMAISNLALRPGDTVVEIGCGTGLNFAYLRRAIGGSGRLIGVDLTDAMLGKAAARMKKQGWRNVDLIRSDAARYEFPDNVNGVLSTFALTLVPEYREVINRAAKALADDGRFVILDFKLPQNWPLWLVRIFAFLTRPFGVTLDLAERRPWEAMNDCFPRVTMEEIYGGLVYIATGEKSP